VAIAPVVIAYATKQDRAKVKSAWIGFGAGILVILILLIIAFSHF